MKKFLKWAGIIVGGLVVLIDGSSCKYANNDHIGTSRDTNASSNATARSGNASTIP